MLALPSGRPLAELLLEALDRGLVAVPLDPRTETPRVTEIVDRVDAAAVVRPDGVARPAAATARGGSDPDAGGLALIMFTSGSTGRPKGVMLPREAALANAAHTAALHRFGPDRPHATCLPLYHCNALVMSLYGTHLTGTPLVLHERFDPTAYFADLDARGATTASVVPALLPALLDAAPPWPSRLEYLITAAAPLTVDLARRFHGVYGPRLRQGYGLTELMNFSFTTPHLDAAGWEQQYLEHHPPVGAPLPGTEVALVDGEVWIRSPERMRGYWKDPETTAAALDTDGWLRTGDLGHDRDGLLVLDGRRTERIDRGGEKAYPLDVERSWRDAGLDVTAAAVPVPDDVLGHEIGLVTADTGDATLATVRRLLAQGPRRPGVVELGGFAATATGKPRRTAMGRRLAAGRIPAPVTAGATATAGASGHADLADRLAPLVADEHHGGGETAVPRLDLTADPAGSLADALTGVGAGAPVLVLHGPGDDHRWSLLTALRDAGAAVVGASVLRRGREDLGGVVWAR